MVSRDPRLHPSVAHPGASASCPVCGGLGWVGAAPCACRGVCPRCADGGFVGMEPCACKIGAERVGLLARAGLPAGRASAPLPAEVAAAFARYRPEDDAPWLTIVGRQHDLAVADAVGALITGIGAPVSVIEPRTAPDEDAVSGRIVLALGLDDLPGERAARVVERCVAEGRTLITTVASTPLGAGDRLPERVAAALWEHGAVFEPTA